MREDGEVGAVDDPGVRAVHPAHLERVRADLVRAEDVAGDVGHHQRNWKKERTKAEMRNRENYREFESR